MKYLMRSVKLALEGVGICNADNWDVKRVDSLSTMESLRFIFIRNKMFDSLISPLVVRYLYTRRGNIIG